MIVPSEHRVDSRLGAEAFVLEEAEDSRAERCHTRRLARDGTDTGFHPRHDRAHGEVLGLYGAADLTRRLVDRDDRKRRLHALRRHRPTLRI
jgi:hypothetical protein